MAITTSQTTDEMRVAVRGDLDLSTVAAFHTAVLQALEKRHDRRFVIDLRETDYIDSAGLEQLLIVNRRLMAQDSRLKVVVKPESQPHSVLRITGFDAVMDVEPAAATQ